MAERDREVFPLARAVSDLAGSVVSAQRILDRAWLESLDHHAVLRETVELSGYGRLAEQLTPSRLVLSEQTVRGECRIAKSREDEWGVGVRLLNLGYARRYGGSGYASQSIEIEVRAVPLVPGRQDRRTERGEA